MSDKRPSVRFKRSEIQEITTHRVNPNPVTWLQLLFDATMQIKTSKGTVFLTFYGKPLTLVEEAARTLWQKTESNAAS